MDARAVMDWQACILSGDVHFFCVGRQKQERGTRVGRNEKRTVLKFYETTPRGRFVVLRFGLRDYRFRCVCVCWSSSSRERNESKKAALLESSLSLSLSLRREHERDETDKVNAPLAPGDHHRVVVFVFRPVETAPADAERETSRRRTRGERFLRFPTPTSSSERKNFCRRRRCERMSARVGDERTREMREGDF